eukprot:CAMPEP_0170607838 /NCGR_PEP_ID=MMETSP0224-20130122/21264_1 /TAXON_ID=285029 /ORGANISM="Togula jolla, Strain CCCM 725" /LENGTH=57 /DNA_ID=CAMNT_0010933023 /DNA_START=720 /DNA_END=893 /DNA_ORIENTATION=+
MTKVSLPLPHVRCTVRESVKLVFRGTGLGRQRALGVLVVARPDQSNLRLFQLILHAV